MMLQLSMYSYIKIRYVVEIEKSDKIILDAFGNIYS